MANLHDIYFDARSSGSLGGVQRLKRAANEAGLEVSTKTVKRFLETQDAYTLFKPMRKNFKRRRVLFRGITDLAQADLGDMTQLAEHNDYKYFLLVINCFTKMAYITPLRTKKAKEVAEAFGKLYRDGGLQFSNMQTDMGGEFRGEFTRLLDDLTINQYFAYSDKKAALVERCIRTIKTRLWRWMHQNNTKTWSHIIKSIVYSYNHSLHRSIGMKPVEVTQENEDAVRAKLFPNDLHIIERQYKYNVGDTVRVSRLKSLVEKGYTATNSYPVYTIIDRGIQEDRNTYVLKDMKGERVTGSFYDEEITRFSLPVNFTWRVERVLGHRMRGGVRQHLVKWLDFPNSYNSWVPAPDLFPLNHQAMNDTHGLDSEEDSE